jgi:hypothetical protein
MMIKRWGILQRPLYCAHDRWSLVTTVTAKLHNFCLDKNVPVVRRYYRDMFQGDTWALLFNGGLEDGDDDNHATVERAAVERATALTGLRRRVITESLAMQGVRRPLYAMINSKQF